MYTFGDIMYTFGDIMYTFGDIMYTFGDIMYTRDVPRKNWVPGGSFALAPKVQGDVSLRACWPAGSLGVYGDCMRSY